MHLDQCGLSEFIVARKKERPKSCLTTTATPASPCRNKSILHLGSSSSILGFYPWISTKYTILGSESQERLRLSTWAGDLKSTYEFTQFSPAPCLVLAGACDGRKRGPRWQNKSHGLEGRRRRRGMRSLSGAGLTTVGLDISRGGRPGG